MKNIVFGFLFFCLCYNVAYSGGYPKCDEEKRGQCKVSILNIVRLYQEYSDRVYKPLYTFEQQVGTRFSENKLNHELDPYLYCIEIGDKYNSFYPKRDNQKIPLPGRWGYHLLSKNSFTDVYMMVAKPEELKSLCGGDDYIAYAATKTGTYNIVFYKQLPRTNELERLTTDNELRDEFYYASTLETLEFLQSTVKNALGFSYFKLKPKKSEKKK